MDEMTAEKLKMDGNEVQVQSLTIVTEKIFVETEFWFLILLVFVMMAILNQETAEMRIVK